VKLYLCRLCVRYVSSITILALSSLVLATIFHCHPHCDSVSCRVLSMLRFLDEINNVEDDHSQLVLAQPDMGSTRLSDQQGNVSFFPLSVSINYKHQYNVR